MERLGSLLQWGRPWGVPIFLYHATRRRRGTCGLDRLLWRILRGRRLCWRRVCHCQGLLQVNDFYLLNRLWRCDGIENVSYARHCGSEHSGDDCTIRPVQEHGLCVIVCGVPTRVFRVFVVNIIQCFRFGEYTGISNIMTIGLVECEQLVIVLFKFLRRWRVGVAIVEQGTEQGIPRKCARDGAEYDGYKLRLLRLVEWRMKVFRHHNERTDQHRQYAHRKSQCGCKVSLSRALKHVVGTVEISQAHG